MKNRRFLVVISNYKLLTQKRVQTTNGCIAHDHAR